jgi:hypothetical protein
MENIEFTKVHVFLGKWKVVSVKKIPIFIKTSLFIAAIIFFRIFARFFYSEYEEVCHYGDFGLSMSHGMWTEGKKHGNDTP